MANKFSEKTDKELMILVRDVGSMKYGQGTDLMEECLFRLMMKVFYENESKEEKNIQ